MPSNNRIQSSVANGVARLLLDKPAKMNALDREMLGEIEKLLSDWEQRDASVVVLGSTSARAFSVGADLAVLAEMNETTMQEWELLGNRVLDRLQHSPLISIAAIPGHCLGGGLTLAAACDFRIAADTAHFAQPEIELGWIPGWGGVARLARFTGAGRAKELCMTGRRIDAAHAQAIGLIEEVVPSADLDARVSAFAGAMAARSPAALRAIKDLADSFIPAPPDTAHRFDALVNASLLNDPRGQAAIARFLSRKSASESS
jgi:enoyl-CoA hydratase/carnithine racemase